MQLLSFHHNSGHLEGVVHITIEEVALPGELSIHLHKSLHLQYDVL